MWVSNLLKWRPPPEGRGGATEAEPWEFIRYPPRVVWVSDTQFNIYWGTSDGAVHMEAGEVTGVDTVPTATLIPNSYLLIRGPDEDRFGFAVVDAWSTPEGVVTLRHEYVGGGN